MKQFYSAITPFGNVILSRMVDGRYRGFYPDQEDVYYQGDANGLTDLTEVEFHAKGGTFIPDFNPRQFNFLMKLHNLDNQEQWKPIAEAVQQQVGASLMTLSDIRKFGFLGNDKTGCENCGYFNHQKAKCNCDCGHIAQLSPEASASGEEHLGDTEGGEKWTCITCNAEHPTILLTCPFCSGKVKHSPSVTIELTGIQALKVLHIRGLDREVFDTICKQIDKQLTPPMQEPKEFGAMVEANLRGFSERKKWIRLEEDNPDMKEWISSDGNQFACWSNLINPRIIEGEK